MDRLSPVLFQKEMVVEEHHLASVWGNLGAEVLSTHWVVLLMEVASRTLWNACWKRARWSWAHGSVSDIGAVPKGVIVRAESHLKEINGRKLTFDVSVYDPKEKIAEGRNELLIVSADKFLERVKRKF